jgi:hypothetical protein
VHWSKKNALKINSYHFFCYRNIDTKFPPLLVMTNLRLETCGTYKVSSPLPTEFFPYAWARNRTPEQLSFLIYIIIINLHIFLILYYKLYYFTINNKSHLTIFLETYIVIPHFTEKYYRNLYWNMYIMHVMSYYSICVEM